MTTDTTRIARAWVIAITAVTFVAIWAQLVDDPFPGSRQPPPAAVIAATREVDPIVAGERALAARARRVNAALAARQRRHALRLARRQDAIERVLAENDAALAAASVSAANRTASSYGGSDATGGGSWTPVVVDAPRPSASPPVTQSSSS